MMHKRFVSYGPAACGVGRVVELRDRGAESQQLDFARSVGY